MHFKMLFTSSSAISCRQTDDKLFKKVYLQLVAPPPYKSPEQKKHVQNLDCIRFLP